MVDHMLVLLDCSCGVKYGIVTYPLLGGYRNHMLDHMLEFICLNHE